MTVVLTTNEFNTFNLYVVEVGSTEHGIPFKHRAFLEGKGKEAINIKAMWDDGCMITALSTKKYEDVKELMKGWEALQCRLRMANGNIVQSTAYWKGNLTVEGTTREVNIEVFDSAGGWEFLLEKPVMEIFRFIHDYSNDTVIVPTITGEQVTLNNEVLEGIEIVREAKDELKTEQPPTIMGSITTETPEGDFDRSEMVEIPLRENNKPGIYTTTSNPFKKERVDTILAEIQIGPDLTEEQRQTIQETIWKYADCFVLSVSEVFAVEGAVHKVNIPEGAIFPKINRSPHHSRST